MRTVIPEETRIAAYKRAPNAVQAALDGGIAVVFVLSLRSRFNLHIDSSGKIMGLMRDMLIGLLSPADFVTELRMLVPDQATADQIVAAVNAEVFVPIQKEVRTAGVSGPAMASAVPDMHKPAPLPPPTLIPVPSKTLSMQRQPSFAVPQASLPAMPSEAFLEPHHIPVQPAPPAPVPSVNALETFHAQAAKQVAPPPNLPGQEPVLPKPVVAPVAPTPKPITLTGEEAEKPAAPIEHHHPSRTMAGDMQALKKGVDPYRVAHPEPPAWATLEAPATPSTAQTPRRPTAPLPPPQPQQAQSSSPQGPATAPAPVVKNYGSDPYREPIEA